MQLIELSKMILSQHQHSELKKLLSDLHSRDCGKYDELCKILPIISTVYSEEDYADFISQGFFIMDDLFILGYLSYCGKCMETSNYDEELFNNIADYIKQQTGLDIDIQADEDAIMRFWEKLRDLLVKNHYTLLIFHSDHYYDNQVFVIVLDNNEYCLATDDEWYYNI